MSATIDILDPDQPKRILMLVSNPTTSSVTGWPVGFWWAEVTHPWWAFREAGYQVTLASPAGGDLEADSWSDPRDASGYSAHDILTLGFVNSPEHAKLVKNTPSLEQVDPSGYDALFVAGGQSPMVTMADDEKLHRFIADFYEAGKVVAIVCHAACTLLKTRLSDGALLVAGKSWTGFADAEERFADASVGRKIQPFWIESEARKVEGTNFVVAAPFRPYALRDGRLVTGQQQYSGAAAAELVIEALGR
jgi:putative intracellular protease/amidase